MNLTDKQIYDLNNMNVAAQNVALGNMLDEMVFSDSPEFTGTPTAPTAEAGTDDNQIATTAFVQNAVSGGGGGGLHAIIDNGQTTSEIAEALIEIIENNEVPILLSGGFWTANVIQYGLCGYEVNGSGEIIEINMSGIEKDGRQYIEGEQGTNFGIINTLLYTYSNGSWGRYHGGWRFAVEEMM